MFSIYTSGIDGVHDLILDTFTIQMYFQITLHISYVHAAVNPLLFMALHRALRRAALQLCCGCCVHWSQFVLALTAAGAYTLLSKLNGSVMEK